MSNSDDCAREIVWAGGTHIFSLNHPWVKRFLSVRGLPGQFGDTPAACLRRFHETVQSDADVERIMELGLIGGGLTRPEASALLDQHVRGKPIAPNALIAFQVIAALFVGEADGNAAA